MNRKLFPNWIPCHSHTIVGSKSHLLYGFQPIERLESELSSVGVEERLAAAISRRTALKYGFAGLAAGCVGGVPTPARANVLVGPVLWAIAPILAEAAVISVSWFLKETFRPVAERVGTRITHMLDTAINTIEAHWDEFWKSLLPWNGERPGKIGQDKAYTRSARYNDLNQFPASIRFEPTQTVGDFGFNLGISEQFEPFNLNGAERISLRNAGENFLSSAYRIPSYDPDRQARNEDRWLRVYDRAFRKVNDMYVKHGDVERFSPGEVEYVVPLRSAKGKNEVGFAIKRKNKLGDDQVAFLTTADPAERPDQPKKVEDAVKWLQGATP